MDACSLRYAVYSPVLEMLSGAERAFGKLKGALGMERLEAELILIDPKGRPSAENEKKIEAFCEQLKTDE